MRLIFAALAAFLCATMAEADPGSSLTRPNNDASLRRTPGVGGPTFYRGRAYPREQRRGRRPPNGSDTKGRSAEPI